MNGMYFHPLCDYVKQSSLIYNSAELVNTLHSFLFFDRFSYNTMWKRERKSTIEARHYPQGDSLIQQSSTEGTQEGDKRRERERRKTLQGDESGRGSKLAVLTGPTLPKLRLIISIGLDSWGAAIQRTHTHTQTPLPLNLEPKVA